MIIKQNIKYYKYYKHITNICTEKMFFHKQETSQHKSIHAAIDSDANLIKQSDPI